MWYRPYRALKIGTLEPAKWTAKNTRCDQLCGFIDIISTLVSDPHPNGFTVQILRQNCSESLKVYLLLHLAAKLHQNVPGETESLFSEAQLRITAICKCSKGSTNGKPQPGTQRLWYGVFLRAWSTEIMRYAGSQTGNGQNQFPCDWFQETVAGKPFFGAKTVISCMKLPQAKFQWTHMEVY